MADKKQFKAESQRLLDLMINSIYTHKEIFLRELISNASDASDKLYYKALTEKINGISRDDLSIQIVINKDHRMLSIIDQGIGMNEQELEEHLGTIANSGSFEFKNALEKGEADVDIIGQFGVGFYSAFMVAHKVEVISKKYGEDKGYIWESDTSDGYTIQEFDYPSHGERMNLRVSIVPTVHGEKIVLRYLNSNTPIDYANHFGMNDENYEKMMKMMDNPNGIIYVTGPTGSGKTTTLYMIMEKLAKRDVNILTIEDPVEKTLDRINQMQVNNVAGLTFESGLRAILRQDPDIIMVGETRDAETASISVRAAITGHLVVSTLHTNDAISTIVRLEDMGIEPYMVSNSVVGIVAQRLVKKVCPHCAKKVKANDDDKRIMGKDIEYVYQSVGCPACHHTGYKGRIAVHEMILIDKRIRRMISDKNDISDIFDYVKVNQNYHSLFEETLKLVEEGKTTVNELLKISYYER